jgi:hypothetical protein
LPCNAARLGLVWIDGFVSHDRHACEEREDFAPTSAPITRVVAA